MSNKGNACTLEMSGAIFDFDGTLFESMGLWDNLVVKILLNKGITPKPDLREVTKTMTIAEVAQLYIDDYGVEGTVEQLSQEAVDMVKDAYINDILPKPGAEKLLKNMQAQGIRMTIATTSPRKEVTAALKRTGLLKYFDNIFVAPEVGIGKDSPEIYYRALLAMGTRKEATWVFEDAAHGVITARDAGFKVCAVKEWSAADQEEEIKKNANVFVDSLEDVEVVKDTSQPDYSQLKSVVTIAGSDSSGGAGVQADLKTFAAQKVFGQSVITALTAQNTMGVHGVLPIEPDFVKAQLDAVFTDIYPDAVKIGMVDNVEIIKTIASALQEYQAKNIVVDPVMVATSGGKLMQDDATEAIVTYLFPLADVVTPNLSEAQALCGFKVTTREDMERAAQEIAKHTSGAVLIKGGHLDDTADDLVWYNGSATWISGERFDNDNTHGTGCTLSSAIAAQLAQGRSVVDAVIAGKRFVSGAIAAGLNIGKGHGPLDHMYQYR